VRPIERQEILTNGSELNQRFSNQRPSYIFKNQNSKVDLSLKIYNHDEHQKWLLVPPVTERARGKYCYNTIASSSPGLKNHQDLKASRLPVMTERGPVKRKGESGKTELRLRTSQVAVPSQTISNSTLLRVMCPLSRRSPEAPQTASPPHRLRPS
jgi:hypothetical protein